MIVRGPWLAAACVTALLAGIGPASSRPAEVADRIFAADFEAPGVGAVYLATAMPPQGFQLSERVAPIVAVNLSHPGAAPVHLRLDDVEVTAAATLGPQNIVYEAPAPLAIGLHRVDVQSGDASGSWTFEVVTAPDPVSLTPNGDRLPYGSQPTIEAVFADAGADIDPASLMLSLNDTAVIDAAQIEAADARHVRIRYVPPQPLPDGAYRLSASAANVAGTTSSTATVFSVDPAAVHVLQFVAPADAATVPASPVAVRFLAWSNVADIAQLSLNDQPVRRVGSDGGHSVFGADVPLQAGTNVLTARVQFSDGDVRTATHAVVLDAPPVVSVTTPHDWQVFGPEGAPPAGAPRDLTGSVERAIGISGTVSRPATSVSINQQAATLGADGRSFSFERYFLHEGTNLISVDATDEFGRVGSTQLTVYVDYTAPLLTVEQPLAGAATSAAYVDVRGTVNDAVEAGLAAPEPTVIVANAANGRSVEATVHDRFYTAARVPLEVGANHLSATARDALGNTRSATVDITRIAAGSRRLTLLGGDRQSAAAGSDLPQPLTLAAVDAAGLPLADLPVRFDVVRGSGSLATSSGANAGSPGRLPVRSVLARTDAAGRAAVWLTLGSEAGPGANVVRAASEGLAEEVVFTATGERLPASVLSILGSTGYQYAQTDSQPLDALAVVVRDRLRNPAPDTPVQFRIVTGDARFTAASALVGVVAPDGRGIAVTTDKDGRAAVRPLLGSAPGQVDVAVEAHPDSGTSLGDVRFRIGVLARRDAATQFGGVVLDHTGAPLAGVRLSIARTSLSAVSDAQGRFQFEDQVPPGKIDLFVDGRDVQGVRDGVALQYPALHFETAVVQGQANQLPHPIYLPPIVPDHAAIVGGDADVVLRIAEFDGFEMHVKAHSVTFPDGSHEGPVVVTAVHKDRLPMVAPGANALFSTLAWTIQPAGTRFDPPIEVRIPNVDGMQPGETAAIVQWDHDLGAFVPMGRATVSEDATRIVTDPGSGITKAGWGGCTDCPPITPNTGDNQCHADGSRLARRTAASGKVRVTADLKDDALLKPQAMTNATPPAPDPAGTSVSFLAEPLGDCGQLDVSWNFGDGTPASAQLSVSHAFAQPGEYDVVATPTCHGCPGPLDPVHLRVRIFKIEITAPAIADIIRMDATPKMPDLTFTATVTPASAAADLTYEWKMDTQFKKTYTVAHSNGPPTTEIGRDDTFHFPDGGGTQRLTGQAGLNWKVDWASRLVASDDVTVVVSAYSDDAPTARATQEKKGYKIHGDNPGVDEVKNKIGNTPYYIHRMVNHESSMHQFNPSGGGFAGLPNYGYPHGFGIMQFDPATEPQVYNWDKNAGDGPAKVAGKVNAGTTFWNQQVSQYDAYEADAHNPRIPVHDPIDEGGANCSFSHATDPTFLNPISIKLYNGAPNGNYIVWSNGPGHAPAWVTHTVNDKGVNYVNLVCNTAEP